MTRLALVSFDAADTLFTERSSRAALYAEAFAARGHDADEPRMAAWMADAHARLLADPSAPRVYSRPWFRAFVAALLARAGARDDPEAVRAELEDVFTRPETYTVYGDVLPCLEGLAERGLRLAVASNWSDRLPGLLHDLGLARHFEECAVSALVGAEKPDPRLFRWLLERVDLPAARVLHVGNDPRNDVTGAHRAGLAALHLDRERAAPAGPGRVHDLAQLLERLSA